MKTLLAATAAASLWSPPANVSSPHTFLDAPRLAFSGDGTALASWSWQDGLGRSMRHGTAAAGRPPGGNFGTERRVPSSSSATTVGPVTYGRSRAVLGQLFADRVAVRFGSASGSFGPLRTLAFGRKLRRPVIAGNARGDVAVAWFHDRGTANDRVYVSIRRAGGRFARPVRLEQGRIRSVSVAVGARGDVLVAWDAAGVVRARMRKAGRRGFDREDTIRSEEAFSARLQTAVASNGRAYVGWTSQHLTEGGPAGSVIHQVAVRPAGNGTRFRDAQLLEIGGATAGPLKMGVDSRGKATVAWTGHDEGKPFDSINFAVTDARGVFRRRPGGSDPASDALLGDLAVAPSGAALAVWVIPASDAGDGQVVAAFRPAGAAAFGSPEAVTAPEQARVPSAAFDPRSGRPLVIWSNRPDRPQAGAPIASIRTYAQVSERTG